MTVLTSPRKDIIMGRIIGYVRVSTKKQRLDRQITNVLSAYPNAELRKEYYTGTTVNRPQWDRIKKEIKEGDIIVFDSVSRMSRNAEEGFEDYQTLYRAGVELVFLKEPHISTQTYKGAIKSTVPLTGTSVDSILKGVNEYLLELAKKQIFLAFEQAEKEVNDLHARISEGLRESARRGKQIGQKKGTILTTKKSIECKKIIQTHSKSFGGTLTDVEVMRLCGGIARNTYYRYKNAVAAGMAN